MRRSWAEVLFVDLSRVASPQQTAASSQAEPRADNSFFIHSFRRAR